MKQETATKPGDTHQNIFILAVVTPKHSAEVEPYRFPHAVANAYRSLHS